MTPELKAAVERVENELSAVSDYGFVTAVVRQSDLRLILAALAEREWRPIETAPRDGTRFDVWDLGGWRDPECWHASAEDAAELNEPGFVGHLVYRMDNGELNIVHCATDWMPLPPPPQEGGE